MEKDASVSSKSMQHLHRVADGHFTMAVKVYGSSGVTPYNAHTLKAFEAKQSYKPPPSIPTILFFEAPLVAKVDTIFR